MEIIDNPPRYLPITDDELEELSEELFLTGHDASIRKIIGAVRGRDPELLDETLLHSMKVEKGEVSIETSGGAGHKLITALVNFYEANGGANYFTMTFEGTVRKKHKRLEVTIRNLYGNKSPAETIVELKEELYNQRKRIGEKILFNKCDNNCDKCILCDNAGGCIVITEADRQKDMKSAEQGERKQVLTSLRDALEFGIMEIPVKKASPSYNLIDNKEAVQMVTRMVDQYLNNTENK